MKKLTVLIYLMGASTGYLHQPFEGKLAEDIYFIQEALTGGSVATMWLIYKFSKPEGWFKYFQQGLLSLTIGGLIDTTFEIENNPFTIGALAVVLIYTIWMAKKKHFGKE